MNANHALEINRFNSSVECKTNAKNTLQIKTSNSSVENITNSTQTLQSNSTNSNVIDTGNLSTSQVLLNTKCDATNETLFFTRSAIINNGVCFETRKNSLFLELSNPCSQTDCFFAVWIKYLCEINTEAMIFNTPFLSLWCYSTPDYNLTRTMNYSKVRVHIDSCPMLINAKNGFWFHFAYIRKDDHKEILVDGKQVEIDEDCDTPAVSNPDEIVIGKSKTPTCMDEIVLSKILPSTDAIKEKLLQMYNQTIYGGCLLGFHIFSSFSCFFLTYNYLLVSIQYFCYIV